MLIQLFFIKPIVFFMAATAVLLALTIHEYFHAWMAYFLGDSTAKDQGRLSINPLVHLDPLGTLFIFILGFGWGKPVPFNPDNLRNRKSEEMLVGFAGPFSNFLMALIFGLVLRFSDITNPALLFFFSFFVLINLNLGIFNLLPIPPLDGSHIFFNLLPVSLLTEKIKNFLTQYQFFVLIFIVFVLFRFLQPLISIIYKLIVGMPLIF
jgi:Zn-dependent protease